MYKNTLSLVPDVGKYCTLNIVIETVHDKLKNFVCELCTKAFGRKHDLKVHVDRRHKRHMN